eukprot:Nitzschia sp. Nitz4//scaffold296_size27349//7555//8910//NITZ4_008198-RA/size27349-processed-gene-0.29-mRNA-1//-1//CDS//3329546267//5952//frame0
MIPLRFSLWKLCLFLWLLVSPQGVWASKEAEATCDADGTCSSNTQQQLVVEFVNDSTFRADIFYDDGRFGVNVATVESRGGSVELNSFVGDSFFVTRHGVREGLFDLETDQQYRFTVTRDDETFVIPKKAAPSQNLCQDRYSICTYEAKRGECWANPGWMIVHCCKSCGEFAGMDAERLIDPKIRCSREYLNMTEPTWQPGDLNDLFVSWITDEQFQQFEPKVISSPQPEVYGGQIQRSDDPSGSPPWVVVFENFLSDKEADALIAGGELVGFQRSTDQGRTNSAGEQERVVSTSRTSSNAWCVHECEALPEVNAVTKRIEQVTKIPRKNYEQFQILEYENGQFYRMHHDSSAQSQEKIAGPRILTFFLYLTDVEEGGETKFNKLGVSVAPKRGRALVWPSVYDDKPGVWDPRMYHEARPVISGVKYAANHWIHLYDFNAANKWGCTGSFG